jgi:hypothetical protein
MKLKVLNWLKTEGKTPQETFQEGFNLLMKTDRIPNSLIQNYNNRGYTPQSLQTLKYDLQKLHAISDMDIRNFTVAELPVQENILAEKNVDKNLFMAANKDLFTNILREMNDEEIAGFKMTDQYPFLETENCPKELKSLAWDAVSAFHRYKDAHTDFELVKDDVEKEVHSYNLKFLGGLTSNVFKKKSRIWCKVNGYEFEDRIMKNIEYKDSEGNIIYEKSKPKKITTEHIKLTKINKETQEENTLDISEVV